MTKASPSGQQGSKQEGFSLLEMLIAIVIGGVLVYGMTSLMKNMNGGSASVDLAYDRVAIKQMLLKRVDCKKTLAAYTPPSSCTGLISLLDSKGQVLVAGTASGTKIGAWNYQANCGPGGITVLTAAYGNTGGFKVDQMTGVSKSWGSLDSSLFPNGAGPCQAKFATVATGVLFGGYIYRCPSSPGGGSYDPFAQQIVAPGSPINVYSGTYNCPNGYVPRQTKGEIAHLQCECQWLVADPTQRGCNLVGPIQGIGLNQFACLKSTDGSAVPGVVDLGY